MHTFNDVGADETARAMKAARRERVRNVLDNRGLSYDEGTLEQLVEGDEEDVMQFLVDNGVSAQQPLDDRLESGLSIGGLEG